MNEADIVAAKIAAKRKKLEEAAARRRSSSSDTTGSADMTGSTDSTGSTDLTGSTDTTGDAAATPPPATPPPITPPPVSSSPPPATPAAAEPAKPPKTHVELSAPAAVKPAAPASTTPPRPPSARTQAAAPAPAPPVPPPTTVVTEPALPPWLLAVAALAVVIIIVMVMRPGPKDVEPPAPGPITQPGTTETAPVPVVTPATEALPPPATEAPPPPATEAPPPPPASETPPPPASETPPPTTTQPPPPPPVTPPPVVKVNASHVAPVVSATSALGRVDVSWTPSVDSHHVVVRAYEVLRRPVAGGEWTKIGDTAGDARTHADATAPVGTGSVYKVVSVASPTSDAVLAAGADRAESAVSPPAMPIREFVVIPVSVTVPTEEEQARNPEDKGVASVTVHRWDPETSSYQRKIFRVQVGAPVGLPDKLRGGRPFDFTTGASLDEVRVETRKHPTLGHDRQVQVISLRFADGSTEEFDDTMEPPK